MTPNEGDILAGKYRVENVLGEGAMGVVVAAMHVHLGERVALKFLKPELAGNQEVVARFLREAQSAVRIKGEHIARVSDVGTLETRRAVHGHGVPDGERSRRVVEKRGKLDIPHGGRLRDPGVRRARRGALARHRPPRSQAVEPLSHEARQTARRS